MDHRDALFPFRVRFVFALWAFASAAILRAVPAELWADPVLPGLSADLLWSGSLEDNFLKNGSPKQGGSLVNRGDLRLRALGFSVRGQVIDKRPFPPWENPDQGNTAISGGFYHGQSGSRLLYGILDEWGLPARLRNPWGKSVPAAETRRLSSADLKTEASSVKKPAAYLYLGTLPLGKFRFFGAAQIDGKLAPAFNGGLELTPAKKTRLGLEGFYTGAALPPEKPVSWFSEKPPLPKREFALYGLNFFCDTPFAGLSSDWAYSETFAFGRDIYGSLALRLGDRPWRLSLGADGAGSRFSDREGTAIGAGVRTALTAERRGKGSSLLRARTSLRAGSLGEAFDRSDTVFRYRFPEAPGRAGRRGGRFGVRLSSVSLEASRKKPEPAKTLDSLGGSAGFRLGPVRAVLNTTVTGMAGRPAGPYPGIADSHGFDTLNTACELDYSPGNLQFKTKLGYTLSGHPAGDGGESLWDTSFSAAIRGKTGRFSVKMDSPHFPKTWTCTLSWRAEKKGLFEGARRRSKTGVPVSSGMAVPKL
jgi:hypothetical protein